MRKNFLKRTLAGVLSAVTLCSSMAVSVPTAFAAEEDNKASAIEIKVGETYNVADKGVSKAWFQQNGAPRNVWPMFTKASDGTEIRAYCADHAKGNPGTGRQAVHRNRAGQGYACVRRCCQVGQP